MTHMTLLETAERLRKRIVDATPEQRIALQPEFSRLMDQLRLERIAIPRRLLQLEADLADEAIEARFDNMPL